MRVDLEIVIASANRLAVAGEDHDQRVLSLGAVGDICKRLRNPVFRSVSFEARDDLRSIVAARFHRSLDIFSEIDCPSTPAAPWLAFTLLKASQRSRLGMSNGFASSTGSSRCQMASVGPWPWLNNAAPSVQPHYRAFVPTTGCSVPVLRIGTLILAV